MELDWKGNGMRVGKVGKMGWLVGWGLGGGSERANLLNCNRHRRSVGRWDSHKSQAADDISEEMVVSTGNYALLGLKMWGILCGAGG